jgi:myotubularin-related protein 1/2
MIVKTQKIQRSFVCYGRLVQLQMLDNQAAGAGYEDNNRYKQVKIHFLQIPNIHVMRESVRKLLELCLLINYNKSVSSTFLSNLDSSHWLEYICLILHSALRMAKLLNEPITTKFSCSTGICPVN